MKKLFDKIRKALNKVNEVFKKRLFKADMLTVISFLIIFFTTFTINIHVAFYLLAAFLLMLSYLIAKGGD